MQSESNWLDLLMKTIDFSTKRETKSLTKISDENRFSNSSLPLMNIDTIYPFNVIFFFNFKYMLIKVKCHVLNSSLI